jgi:hypothetical protein
VAVSTVPGKYPSRASQEVWAYCEISVVMSCEKIGVTGSSQKTNTAKKQSCVTLTEDEFSENRVFPLINRSHDSGLESYSPRLFGLED